MVDCLNPAEVNDAFLAAPPLIAEQILDLTVKHPNWMAEQIQYDTFPLGAGTSLDQLIFRGQMPQIERGFDQWKKLQSNVGCDPCDGPDSSYNWTDFGGSGMQRKTMNMMRREFKTPRYPVHEIQNTLEFMEVFSKVVQNIYRQTDFFKEINVAQNILTSLAKKFVVDSGGFKFNNANPYVYPNIGTATLSALNIDMLSFLYEQLRRIPDVVPYDVVDGSPIYAMTCSAELLSRMYRDDPQLRQDVRYSSMANELLMKYNFITSIRGMFIPAPVLYPRRFNVDGSNNIVEVYPFVNGIPADVGSYTGLNPAYMSATYEEVLIHGMHPAKVFTMPTAQTLGENTSFGPEYDMFQAWQWVNPQTINDPFRREGFFATSANLGISQQYSEGIFGVLVARPSTNLAAAFNPEPTCPPTAVSCDNEIPDSGCPCPLILSVTDHPIDADTYFASLAVPITPSPSPSDEIQFGVATGGYVVGTVVTSSSDDKVIEFTLPAGTDVGVCDQFTTIFCDDLLGCFAIVDYASDCRSGQTGVIELTLRNPIKAVDAGDTITVTFGDGTSLSMDVVSVDMLANLWVVEYSAGAGPTDDPTGAGATVLEADLLCDRNGVVSVCVPTATDATCPGCDDPVVTQCSVE